MQDGPADAPVTQVLIADQIAHIIEHLEKLADFSDLVQVCGVAREPAELVDEARLRQPDVVLLGAGLTENGESELAHVVEAVAPHARILVIKPADANGDVVSNGVRAIAAGTSGAELVAAIRTANDAELTPETTEVAPQPSAPEPIHDVTPRSPRAAGEVRGEVFVVHSGKGGVGKSVLASNLAVALAVEANSKVALVDLDLQHGDAGIMLHTDLHAKTIDDLADIEVNQESLHEVMASGPEGVRVLLAPPSPDRAAHVARATVRSVLQELRRTYDHIVVDTPAHLDDVVLDTIQDSDALLLVTTFNVTTVKSSRSTLRLLRTMGVNGGRVVLILNQMRPRTSVPRAEIEEILRYRMLTQLPYEPVVDDAVDSGRPVVLSHPRSQLSRHVDEIVHYLVPGAAQSASAQTPRDEHEQSHAPRRFGLRWHRSAP
ncbi:MAG: P-loop NTPase [Candidatus Dormibacteria bacterium]